MTVSLKKLMLPLCAGLVLLLTSCDAIEDLIDPKYGDEELIELVEGARWKIDSLNKKTEEQRRVITDSVFTNYGHFEFLSPKNGRNPGNGLGYLVRHYTSKDGTAATDTTLWYPGNRDANEEKDDLGKHMTIYYGGSARTGYSLGAQRHVYDFVTKSKSQIIIQSWQRANISNGAELGVFRRYRLSR